MAVCNLKMLYLRSYFIHDYYVNESMRFDAEKQVKAVIIIDF